MKLKPIPEDTTVWCPTKEQAFEFWRILYECEHGDGSADEVPLSHWDFINWERHGINTHYKFMGEGFWLRDWGESITLDEFKQKYVDFDKPYQLFNKGDKVLYDGRVMIIHDVEQSVFDEAYTIISPTGKDFECVGRSKLKPFPSGEVDLYELLKGNIGEKFYSLSLGEVKFVKFESDCLCFINEESDEPIYVKFNGTSRFGIGGVCIIYPSRALYEKYPLDPLKAWSEWQEGQKKEWVVETIIDTKDKDTLCLSTVSLSSTDRDKCISEIKEIINKYQK